MLLLDLRNLSLPFGGLKVLNHFNFALDPGQLVGLIGPNGAGKTTAFNVVTDVYRPTSGDVLLPAHVPEAAWRLAEGLTLHPPANRTAIATPAGVTGIWCDRTPI